MNAVESMIWRVVMSDKGTLEEVRTKWSYLDLFTCIFLLDQQSIFHWMEAKKWQQSES